MNIMRNSILFLGFLLVCNIIVAQEYSENLTTKEVKQAVFDTLSKEIQYETKRKLVPKEFKTDESAIENSQPTPTGGSGLGGGFVQAIGYIIIAVLVLTIFYLIISGIKQKPRIDTTDLELSEVENIEEIDAISGYEEALLNGDYRLALRMQFIKVLQALSTNDLIHWKPDKTNRHYLNETRGLEIHPTFRSLAQTYEWVWYGNSAIGKETFDQLNIKYESFNKLDKVT